jgi:hypothetical protein
MRGAYARNADRHRRVNRLGGLKMDNLNISPMPFGYTPHMTGDAYFPEAGAATEVLLPAPGRLSLRPSVNSSVQSY